MAKKVLIAGYYGFGNLGDEAILEVLLSDLRDSELAIDPIVISETPSATADRFNVESISWRETLELPGRLRSSDALILGGGGIFHDYWPPQIEHILAEPLHGLILYANLVAQADVLGMPVFAYGIGVGPFKTSEGLKLTKSILSKCLWVGVRDSESLAQLESLANNSEIPSIVQGSDLACRHPALSTMGSRTPQGRQKEERVLAVNLRYWPFDSDPQENASVLAAGLDQWIANFNGTIEFIPFQVRDQYPYENDLAYSSEVFNQISDQSKASIKQASDLLEAGKIFNRATLALTSRYHASLMSLGIGVPSVLLSYDPKIDQLAAEFGKLDHVLQLATLDEAELTKLLFAVTSMEIDLPETSATIQMAQDRGERAKDRFLRELEKSIDSPTRMDPIADLIHQRVLQGQVSTSWLRKHGVSETAPSSGKRLLAKLDEMDFLLTKAEREISSFRKAVSQLEEEIEQLENEQEIHQQQIKKLENANEQVAAERTGYLQQKNELSRELSGIRNTLGFKFLTIYWQSVRSLLPEGSGRRRLAFQLNRILKKFANKVLPRRTLIASDETVLQDHDDWMVGHREAFDEFARTVLTRAERSVIILAPTPFDPDQGQRSVHIATELARLGIPVLFAYWRWSLDEHQELHNPTPKIFQTPLDILLNEYDSYLSKFGSGERWLLCEFPYWEMFNLIAAAHSTGWNVIYDVVDDWKAFKDAGQAPWYEAPFEQHLFTSADLVLASSQKLLEKARTHTPIDPVLLPNAGSERIKQQSPSREKAEEGTTIGYFGNLSPAWFDWKLLIDIANKRPGWRFELIGPITEELPNKLPNNIELRGSTQQVNLPEYCAHWHIAIAPFKPGSISDAVDAIKVYEYLGLGLPVIISGIHAPLAAENLVTRVKGVDGFIRKIDDLLEDPGEIEQRVLFAAENTWQIRVKQLLQIVESRAGRLQEKQTLFHR